MTRFLQLPFKHKNYKIIGGWYYDKDDFITKTLESKSHYAIDYQLPAGTPVLAAAAGWAITSYHHYLIRNPNHLFL